MRILSTIIFFLEISIDSSGNWVKLTVLQFSEIGRFSHHFLKKAGLLKFLPLETVTERGIAKWLVSSKKLKFKASKILGRPRMTRTD